MKMSSDFLVSHIPSRTAQMLNCPMFSIGLENDASIRQIYYLSSGGHGGRRQEIAIHPGSNYAFFREKKRT